MRPLPVTDYEYWEDEPIPVIPVRRVMGVWVRVALLVIAAGITAVFAVAIYLNPYRDDRVWTEATHTQLGLPPCTFKVVTEVPCPSCGMTTSFALFIRGDLWNSLQANWAGTLLAALCFVYVPWSALSAWRGRFLGIVSLENTFIRLLVLFLVLMLLRWVIVILFVLY